MTGARFTAAGYQHAASFLVTLVLLHTVGAPPTYAQTTSSDAKSAYDALRAFALDGGSQQVSNFVLKRDRVEMTFTGTVYFSNPVMGRTTSLVFVGQGRFRAEAPPLVFEKENLRRLLKTEVIESNFETAVLRFTDDTAELLEPVRRESGVVPAVAQERARDFEPRMLRESGVNLASRVLLSLQQDEKPGFFAAQFDGGSRGRFTFILDHQSRIPAVNYKINGGEKGIIFTHDPRFGGTIWLAFHSLADYQRPDNVPYSDAFDLVATPAYRLTVDLRDPDKRMTVAGEMDVTARVDRLKMISFSLSEGLGEYESMRLKNALRLKAASIDGRPLDFIQEDWEGGFTLLLPEPRREGERFTVRFEATGDFLNEQANQCFYPFVNGQWYPRHGYLTRSTFDITFLHEKNRKVASAGMRLEESTPFDAKDVKTVYRMEQPVSLVTFALGPFKIFTETFKLQPSGQVPLELFSFDNFPLKTDFVLAEMGNALNYFGTLFGPYPYPIFRAAYHPFGFGQGFATMLVIPNVDTATKGTFLFLSHETGHQWWGNVVGWRSYRDQWLSEGFAEYSGIMYTGKRYNESAARQLIERARSNLREAPRGVNSVGDGVITDIGPIILGHRLSSQKSLNAYQRLIYDKGALVLRMLDFLFSNPSNGDDSAFFAMMKDFVNRNRNSSATTESFMQVANEHFVRSPIAQQFGLTDLRWFFSEWVWQTPTPAYRLEYELQDQPGGKATLSGTLFQEDVPDDWVMPVPVVFKFAGKKTAHAVIMAMGSKQTVTLNLPLHPESVELDPDLWVLSSKVSTKKR